MDRNRQLKFLFVQSLTLGRIPLMLLFLAITLAVDTAHHPVLFFLALGLMSIAALSDSFDGYYARKFDMVTRLGAHADPLTDKVYYLISFPVLVYIGGVRGETGHTVLLLALTILFLFRDQWVSFLRSVGALHNVDAKANWSGKWRTIISFPAVCVIYFYFQNPWREWWFLQLDFWFWFVIVGEVVALLINLVSIYVYTVYYWPYLKKEMTVR